jgi:Glycine zipper
MKKMILIPALIFMLSACTDRTLSEYSSVTVLKSAMQTAAAQQVAEAEVIAQQEAAKQEAARQQTSRVVYRDRERVVYRNSSSHSAQIEKKKGMSSRAKYAIIGGVGGAVIGGVATKSTKGAVIGGVVGAGTGYIIGRKKDKRSGRLQ